jgi:hypothetical protein
MLGYRWTQNTRSADVRRRPNYGGQPSPDKTKCNSRPCRLLGWRASRSSGVSRAKAGGEGSRTPVSCLLYPATSADGLPEPFERRIRFRAQAWTCADVISIVIRWQASGNIRNRSIGPLVSVIRPEGSAGTQRKRQTLRRRSRLPKSSNARRGPSGPLNRPK